MKIKTILSDVLGFIGIAGVCYGLSLFSIPAAVIVASIILVLISIGLVTNRKKPEDD